MESASWYTLLNTGNIDVWKYDCSRRESAEDTFNHNDVLLNISIKSQQYEVVLLLLMNTQT